MIVYHMIGRTSNDFSRNPRPPLTRGSWYSIATAPGNGNLLERFPRSAAPEKGFYILIAKKAGCFSLYAVFIE